MTLLIVLLSLLAAWILAFIGVPLVVWTLGAAALATTLLLAGSIGQTSFTIVAGVIAVLGLLLNILPLRRALLSRFVFSVFKKVLPEMSSTEREVLESGDVWRSEEHTSELQSLMRISYAVFCLKKKKKTQQRQDDQYQIKC